MRNLAGELLGVLRAGAHSSTLQWDSSPWEPPQSLMLLIGWLHFNAGSTGAMSTAADADAASNAALTTSLAGAMGGLCTMLITYASTFGAKFDVLGVRRARSDRRTRP